MANRSIYQKIEERGILEADQIYEDGVKRAEELKAKMLAEATQEVDQLLIKHQERTDDRLKTRSTEIEQQAKQRSLAAKKEIINVAFDKALKKLLSLDDQALVAFVVRILEKETLSGGEVIQVSQMEMDRYLKLFSNGKKERGYVVLDRLQAKLKSQTMLYLDSNPASIQGGFIIVGPNYDVNYSYESILDQLKSQEEITIAELLFGEK